jgi:thiol-disulfide isomerase/thioredoxin
MAGMSLKKSCSRRTWLAGAAALSLPLPLPGRAGTIERRWPARKPAPPLALDDLDGRRWSLAPLRGKVVVLNFWASWCEPCVTEIPTLGWLAETHAARGDVVVLGVNYQEHEAKVRRFLQAVPVPYPVLLDRNGEAAKAWTSRIFPTTVLVGRDGRPVLSVTGELDWAGQQGERLLNPLLAAAPAASR